MSRYSYSCVSKSGHQISGQVNYIGKFNRDEVTSFILGRIARIIFESDVPWDPFNIELVVQAQEEPKPGSYICPVCGATDKAHLCH